jgi:hypothetical protein
MPELDLSAAQWPLSAEEGQPDCQVHSMMQACQDYKRLIGEE